MAEYDRMFPNDKNEWRVRRRWYHIGVFAGAPLWIWIGIIIGAHFG